MRKQIKGILAAALSAAMVVSLGSAAGVNKASAEDTTTGTTTDAKHTYNAILGFESAGDPDWAYRKFVESEDQGIKSKDYDCLTQYMATNTGKHDASMTNAKIDKDGTYTVTIDNIDFSKQKSINMAYVITDIPTAMKGVEFTNVSFPIDFTFFPSVTAVTFDAPLNAPALMLVTAYDSVPTLIVSATFNVFAFLSNPVT